MAQTVAKAGDRELLEAARAILGAEYPIARTGAGISVESGPPPFRGPGGLWTKYGEPPMNGFEIFMSDPRKAWEERLRKRNDELYAPLAAAEPNAGHRALVALEEAGLLKFTITQNIDGLHVRAGHHHLAEIHGNWRRIRCLQCVTRYPWDEVDLSVLPPRCPRCDGLMKSDTVAFGEPIPPD